VTGWSASPLGGGASDFFRTGAGADSLSGGSGADTLDGGAGADTMRGGFGSDVYFVDNAGDVLDEGGGNGPNEVRSTVNWTLAQLFANLVLLGDRAVFGRGNSDHNQITGQRSATNLIGGPGTTCCAGWRARDTLSGRQQ
jgi:Ca2+-binding RTX toxin-like protein